MNQAYDLIGDIHGHADELIELLEHMGYQPSTTGHHHMDRKVIFVGDFIDRGEHLRQHRKLLDTVMPMVRNGHALAVMGNHEFNALAYHTNHNGRFLRPHNSKNTKQHQAFLNEYADEPELKQEVLDFFYELPLWLELDNLRVVHACWDNRKISAALNLLGGAHLTPEALIEATNEDSHLYDAIETLLKGVEVELPEGISFHDKDGHPRTAVRVQWWNSEALTLGEMALPYGVDIGAAGSLAAPDALPIYEQHQKPCFIGHYWLKGTPQPLAANVACLDYSVAREGKLVAYRWNGESQLQSENFIYTKKH